MNPEKEAQAAKAGLTYWELLALESIDKFGWMNGGSGSSAVFDAGWALARRGLLRVDYTIGVRLMMAEAGAATLKRAHQ